MKLFSLIDSCCNSVLHALANLIKDIDLVEDSFGGLPDEKVYAKLTPTIFAAGRMIIQFSETRMGKASLARAPLTELQAIFMTLIVLMIPVWYVIEFEGQSVGVLRSD